MALFNRKNKEDKKHKGENIIGKIIYGFLLFAPLLNILTRCLYVTFNKNAYQSYSQKTEDALIKITNASEIYEDLNYNLVYTNNRTTQSYSAQYGYKSISIEPDATFTDYNPQINYNQFAVTVAGYIYFYDENANRTYKQIWGTSVKNIQFVSDGITINDGRINLGNSTLTYQTIDKGTLDNVFSYSVSKVEEDKLYSWSKETGTYTVLQTTCTGLGITNTFVPMLMSYWLIISVIYFVFDIALILVWAVHDKIHELKDSI